MPRVFASLFAAAAAAAALLLSPAARADDTNPPVITHTAPAPGSLPKGKAFTVSAKITDESKFFPQVFFRHGPGGYDKPLDMKKKAGSKDQYEATIPYKSDTVEYYLEAYDEFGNGPARAGDPDKPFKVKLGEEAAAPPPVVAARSSPSSSTGASPAASSSSSRSAPMSATASSGGGGGGRIWTWLAGGVGLGLLTGGLMAGLAVKSADDAYKLQLAGSAGPGGVTTVPNVAALQAQADANKSLGSKATILTISGAVLFAGGVALYFVEGGSGGSDEGRPAPRKGSPGPKKPAADDGESGFTGFNDAPPVAPPAATATLTGVGIAPVEGGAVVGLAGRF